MSLIQINISENIKRENLDKLLAEGWFRSSFLMYKSPILCINGTISTVINIRLNLLAHLPKKRHRKLLRKNNKKYHFSFSSVQLTFEAERLYRLNKNKFKGFIHPSLHGYLYAEADYTPFETYQFEVFDGDKLIALSFVDVGSNSMASILGLYDPEYSRDSLGIYTMLLEIIEAKSMGLNWYYPGYVVDGDDSFNYKLSLGEFEAMLPNYQWIDYSLFDKKNSLGRQFLDKIDLLNEALNDKIKIQGEKFIYPHFSLGFVEPYHSDGFLDKPAFIKFTINLIHYIVSYDLMTNEYTLEVLIDEPNISELISEVSEEYKSDSSCWTGLIRTTKFNSYASIRDLIGDISF